MWINIFKKSLVINLLRNLSLVFIMLFLSTTVVLSADKTDGFGKYKPFSTIYEPSGIEQLPDGRFIVVEDEMAYALSLFTFNADGISSEQRLPKIGKLDDLEGVAIGRNGFIYAITSHSKKKNGQRKANREQLVRFRLKGNQIVDFETNHSLGDLMGQHFPFLEDSSKKFDDDVSFNIEGLSFDANKEALLIGIRSPLVGKKAVIITLKNPDALFDKHPKQAVQDLVISEQLIHLDLKGGGIRAITYDSHLGGYLIASRKLGKAFKLWLWNGKPKSNPQRVKVPDLKDLRHLEGISSVNLPNGMKGIVLVSDDGDAAKNKRGHFVFLKYEQLEIKND